MRKLDKLINLFENVKNKEDFFDLYMTIVKKDNILETLIKNNDLEMVYNDYFETKNAIKTLEQKRRIRYLLNRDKILQYRKDNKEKNYKQEKKNRGRKPEDQRIKWTEDRLIRLFELKKAGLTKMELSKVFGVSFYSIKHALKNNKDKYSYYLEDWDEVQKQKQLRGK